MRNAPLFAVVASLLVLATASPSGNALDPTALLLPVSQADSVRAECLAAVAAETPGQREGRIVGAMDYVRAFHPDLDEAGVRQSAEMLIAERCQFAAFDPPPARQEEVDGAPVVHFGEHSIQHDLFLNRGTRAPVNLVFFGLPLGSPSPGPTVRDAMVSAGWREPWNLWGCEGGESRTTLYDQQHGASSNPYPENSYHLQDIDDGCSAGKSRYHLKIWPSATGDTHPGKTRGGYVLGSAHHDKSDGGSHVSDCYDCARNLVANALVAAGKVDSVYTVQVPQANPVDPNPDRLVYYLHMKYPTRPCLADSIVRVYEHAGFGGGCRAFDYELDPDFWDDRFNTGAPVNDMVSSVIVAHGHQATLHWDAFEGGTSRPSTCLDNGLQSTSLNDDASSIRIEPVANAAPCFSSFTTVRGNEWWVQVNVGTNGPAVNAVDVRVNGGDWKPLAKQTWGAWAASYQVGGGSYIQFRVTATLANGVAVQDQSPCYRWIPPANADASQTSCAVVFDAQFSEVGGNDWWVQAKVTANKPVHAVEARVNCGTRHALALQSWGGWAASFYVAPGSKVDFLAYNYDTLFPDRSGGYLWPAATPTTGC